MLSWTSEFSWCHIFISIAFYMEIVLFEPLWLFCPFDMIPVIFSLQNSLLLSGWVKYSIFALCISRYKMESITSQRIPASSYWENAFRDHMQKDTGAQCSELGMASRPFQWTRSNNILKNSGKQYILTVCSYLNIKLHDFYLTL